ncbi:helix-turn-helix domain-containing protein [Streptomyces sp. NPDC052036]|uniref:helix-turn-helix domain-containing protein n=1 Tax=Streptomyces sp. NPDC052036 TaxID=3155171 RepID=UPI003442C3D7
MDWSQNRALRDAARDGDYGRVIKQARKAVGLTQRQLGEACGLSQSAMSRLEDRGVGPYDMTLLASAASHLGIPPNLVGLADYDRNGNSTVERREFLAGVAAIAATQAIPPNHRHAPSGAAARQPHCAWPPPLSAAWTPPSPHATSRTPCNPTCGSSSVSPRRHLTPPTRPAWPPSAPKRHPWSAGSPGTWQTTAPPAPGTAQRSKPPVPPGTRCCPPTRRAASPSSRWRQATPLKGCASSPAHAASSAPTCPPSPRRGSPPSKRSRTPPPVTTAPPSGRCVPASRTPHAYPAKTRPRGRGCSPSTSGMWRPAGWYAAPASAGRAGWRPRRTSPPPCPPATRSSRPCSPST